MVNAFLLSEHAILEVGLWSCNTCDKVYSEQKSAEECCSEPSNLLEKALPKTEASGRN